VIPAGRQHEQQLELIEHLRPVAYTGTPDFLKILLDAGEKRTAGGVDPSGAVSGAAFPPSLQTEIRDRGIDAYQLYATADLGCIAYETRRAKVWWSTRTCCWRSCGGHREPVAPSEVGEIVVTSFDHHHPWIRLALGDLSAVMPGTSSCGRTNTAFAAGWSRRSDHQGQGNVRAAGAGGRNPVAATRSWPSAAGGLRSGEADVMTLKAESRSHDPALALAVGETLRAVTKLGGAIELVAEGSLPNDGKVIDDARSYG